MLRGPTGTPESSRPPVGLLEPREVQSAGPTIRLYEMLNVGNAATPRFSSTNRLASVAWAYINIV